MIDKITAMIIGTTGIPRGEVGESVGIVAASIGLSYYLPLGIGPAFTAKIIKIIRRVKADPSTIKIQLRKYMMQGLFILTTDRNKPIGDFQERRVCRQGNTFIIAIAAGAGSGHGIEWAL